MRLLKTIGVYFLTLIPFAFFEWGIYAWIPGVIALVVAIVYYRRNKKEPPIPEGTEGSQ
jgi:hypothetical protein